MPVPTIRELEELQRNVSRLEADLAAARREHGKRQACIGQLRGDLQLRTQCLPPRQEQLPQDSHDRLASLLQPVLQMCRTIEGSSTQISPSEHLHVPSEPRDVILVLGEVAAACKILLARREDDKLSALLLLVSQHLNCLHGMAQGQPSASEVTWLMLLLKEMHKRSMPKHIALRTLEAMGVHSTEQQQQQLCKLQSSFVDSEQRLRQQCEKVAHRLLTASASSENDILQELKNSAMANDLAGADSVLLHHFVQCLNVFTWRQLAQGLAASYPWVPNLFEVVALAATGGGGQQS